MRRLGLVLLCLLPSACTPPAPPPSTAFMPPDSLGTNADPQLASLNLAQYVFADPGRTYGNPAEAARGVAALDYMAGQLSTSPRWGGMSPITKAQMLQARVAVRQAMGIRVDVPSQAVVNAMLAAGNALAAGNRTAALAALSGPTFAVPPEVVLQRLDRMPYIQVANVATQHAAAAELEPTGGECSACE